jgi:Domain of unknown function (DUF4082)
MDGLSGRPGNGPGSPAAFSGSFQAGLITKVTASALWMQGYYWWVPAGGDTGAQKFATWQLTNTGGGVSQVLVPAATVTSGTLTAGQWNLVPLAAPIGLSAGVPYTITTAWTAVHGFPDVASQFGSGQPYAAGITNGPLFAYSDQGASAPEPFTSNYNQGLFGTSVSDPAVSMPVTGDSSSNFFIDLLVSDTAPANPVYRLFPSQPYPVNFVPDTADNFTLGTEFSLSQPCSLNAVSFYSLAGTTQLPTEIGIWAVSGQTLIASTHVTSPSWSGAAGSGWVDHTYGSPPVLPAGDYKVTMLNSAGTPVIWNSTTNGYWGAGPGASGITSGPLSAPSTATATSPGQSTYNLGASFVYPTTYADVAAGANYWLDVQVSPVTASPGLLAMASLI